MGFPIFPNVPDLPGVPPLLRLASSAPQLADLTGSILGKTLNVSSVAGSLFAGAALNGAGLITGTNIVQQLSGAVGGIGSYAVNVAQTFAGPLSSVFKPLFTSGVGALLGDAFDIVNALSPQWGIFSQGGQALVLADNVLGVEFKQDWAISTYPIEQGGFKSYDKVYVPFDVRVRFSCGGSLARRKAFIASIDAIAATLDLYNVVTPEKIFPSVNVVHQAYNRTATDGLGVIKADVWLLQVSQTATQTFSNTAAPGAADVVNGGTVQAVAATTSQLASLPKIITSLPQQLLGLVA